MPGKKYSGFSHDRKFPIVHLVVSIVAVTIIVCIFGIFCGVVIVWCSSRLPKRSSKEHTFAIILNTDTDNKDSQTQIFQITLEPS